MLWRQVWVQLANAGEVCNSSLKLIHLHCRILNQLNASDIYGSRSPQCHTFHDKQSAPFVGDSRAAVADADALTMVLARILRAVHNCGKFAKTVHLCIMDAQDGNHDDGFSYATLSQRGMQQSSMPTASTTRPLS